MPRKIFISYSHKDEDFKNNLTEHLSGLVQANIVSEWNDRKIIPGASWENEIDENLKSADLILFLISSSFLSSEYCTNVEARLALERHVSGDAQLIPIVVRDVEWSDSPLSKLQGLPKDARPISSWQNEDEAWVNVIKGIRTHINEFQPITSKKNNIVEPGGVYPSESILEWLDDTEISLAHRNLSKIKLSSIYTIPDVEVFSEKDSDLKNYKSAYSLINDFNKFLIFGEEQQGKTSLLKFYYKSLLEKSVLPIYLEGSDIKDINLEKILKKELTLQYKGLSYEEFISSPKKVIIIDNIDAIQLNKKYRDRFISSLCESFEMCIFTLQMSFALLVDEIPALDNFGRAEIVGLGNKKREETIRKWVSLGVEQTISETELYQKSDELISIINSVIRKNIVPPKPIYILMLLQMFEANSKLNLELSSQGHCYQQLIYQSFKNARIDEREFDKYLNVLTELAWFIFINKKALNKDDLNKFFVAYSSTYLEVDGDTIIKKLTNHSILQEINFKTEFKYLYIYYFFVGKKISESFFESSEVQEQIDILVSNLYREDYANILMFVTHHTKEPWILDKLRDVLTELFHTNSLATLEKDQLSFMDDFMKEIPDLVLEQREVQQERDQHNDMLDEQERASKGDDIEPSEPSDILANINKTFKGMEIAGQIIRNRYASLKKDSLITLAENGIGAGLRFLEYFISISDVAKKEIVKIISSHLLENPTLTDAEVKRLAENAYLHLTYRVINAVILKISNSIGSKEAIKIYETISEKHETPAMLLLKLSIELNFLKRVDIQNISCYAEKLSDNFVCTRILKELVIRHIYMFPVSYKEKQQISNLLGLSIKGQNLISQKRKNIG